jgi:hypothetical protein
MTTKPSSEFLFFVGNHSKSHVNLFFSPQKFQFFFAGDGYMFHLQKQEKNRGKN